MKLAYSRKEACEAIGIGVTKLHELINANQLRTKKVGRKTLIIGESIREFLEAA